MAYKKFDLEEGQREEKLRDVIIREVKQAKSGDWQMKVEIPDFSTQFANHAETVFVKKTESWNPSTEINKGYKVMVKRDSLKSDKDGNAKSGEYNDHFWHVVDFSTRQDAGTQSEPAPPIFEDKTPGVAPVIAPSSDFREEDRQARARNSREAIAKDIIVASINKVDSVTPVKAIVLMNLVSIGADMIEGKISLNDALKSVESETQDIHAIIEEVLSDNALKGV